MEKPKPQSQTNLKTVPKVLVKAKQEALIMAFGKEPWDKAWDKGPWDKGHWENRK